MPAAVATPAAALTTGTCAIERDLTGNLSCPGVVMIAMEAMKQRSQGLRARWALGSMSVRHHDALLPRRRFVPAP